MMNKCKWVTNWEQRNIQECGVATGSDEPYCPEHRALIEQRIPMPRKTIYLASCGCGFENGRTDRQVLACSEHRYAGSLATPSVVSGPTLTPYRPEIVVLCGSTRFYDEFQEANYKLTMQGKIVLTVGFYPHAKAQSGHGEGVGHNSAEKVALDELHKRKIDLADRVFVLNVGGYIGESTKSEIEYAIDHDKPIDWLEVTK